MAMKSSSLYFFRSLFFDAFYVDPIAQEIEPWPPRQYLALQKAREPLLKIAGIDDRSPTAQEEVALAGLEVKAAASEDGEARVFQCSLKLRRRDIFWWIYRFPEEMLSYQGIVGDAGKEVHHHDPSRF
jgi:hypothetical protein